MESDDGQQDRDSGDENEHVDMPEEEGAGSEDEGSDGDVIVVTPPAPTSVPPPDVVIIPPAPFSASKCSSRVFTGGSRCP